MCRMYASLGGRGPEPEELLAFRGLCDTGCGGPHGDGWGLVGYHERGAPHLLGKSLLPAALDKSFEAAAQQAGGFRAVLAHLRKASSGAKTLDNTHPFVMGPWSFAHNGTIRGSYPEKLAPGSGMNDSRVLFARVHEHLRNDGEPLDAVRAAIREVQERGFPYTSIVVLLTDGERLYAAREVREDPDEYEVHWQRRGGRVVLCQEPIFPGEWESLPNGHLAVLAPRGVEMARL